MPQSSSRGWRRPNIYDVARYAGVSHQTVSRVINEHPHVRESTRARVLEAIAQMNFTPNSIARALATRQAHRIGVLVDGLVQHGPNRTLRALERAAQEVGYAVSAFSIGEEDASQMDSAVMHLVTQGVDALCVIAPRESSLDLIRQETTGLPTIVIKAEADGAWHTVGVDQREGARMAVRHLTGLGHRRIAHLAGPMNWLDARERVEGWREVLTGAELPEGPIVIGDWTSRFGFDFGNSFDLADTTAVFVANDQMALGVIHGLHGRGVRVPDDVNIIGFDDLSEAAHFLPPLTTVRQNLAELAELALQRLIAAIEGDVEPRHDTIQPELIVRASTSAVLREQAAGDRSDMTIIIGDTPVPLRPSSGVAFALGS